MAYVVLEIKGRIDATLLAEQLLSLAAAAALCVVSFLEHGRSIAPSTVLTVYLVFSAFSDVVQVGLLYVARNLCNISALAFVIFMVKLVLLILEGQEKTSILREPYQHLAPEETAGFFGTAFFWWVNRVLALGYSRILSLEDMPPLASYLDTMKMREAMQRTWDKRSMLASTYIPILSHIADRKLQKNPIIGSVYCWRSSSACGDQISTCSFPVSSSQPFDIVNLFLLIEPLPM